MILIKNVQYLSIDIFNSLKNIIEKRYETVKFIFITNSIDKIPYYFKSFSFNFRIPKINYNELYIFIKKVIEYENIQIEENKIKELIEFHENNISKILINLDSYKKNKLITVNIYLEENLDLILKLIYSKDLNQIETIRKLLYALCSKNIDKDVIINYVYKNVLQKIKTQEKKHHYIDFVANINSKMNNSYKNIIHLEYMLVKSMIFIE